jgi:hypothetical protein
MTTSADYVSGRFFFYLAQQVWTHKCAVQKASVDVNIIVLLRDVFHIGLVIDPRPAVLA